MARLLEIVGLFGTVGHSKWRDPVMKRLDKEGIPYFNPTIAGGWTPDRAEIEAEHLATDRVILFVITGETSSFGSLAETGWAALSAERKGQSVIFVIEDISKAGNKQNWITRLLGIDSQYSASNRGRILVRAHMKKAGVPIYEDVDTAVEAAIKAYRS